MESREEEEVVRRWKGEREREVELEMEEKETGRRGMGRGMIEGVGMDEGMVVVAPGKKRRLIGGVERDVVENMGEDEDEEAMSIRSDRKTAAAGKKRKGRV